MLIRVSGAKAGIKDYLEHGQKEGREFSRDELDERVILDGDLELTDAIINSIARDGEAYLHITMSFREDEVSPETLKAITEEFKDFAFSTYREDEFNFYAEAHLPKLKSYIEKRTGREWVRKPHIHVVIPEVNLLSGQVLNPFGKLDQNTKFLEAFQEHINNKFGLASPKDHRRAEVTAASEVLSRHKGDVFSGSNAELKNKILDEVMGRAIRDYDVFKAMLTEFGEARTRNKGKEAEYQNIKPAGSPKGINLNYYVFSREFIELDDQSKRARLAAGAGIRYETADLPRPIDQQIQATLTEWHHVRCREIKYLNSGNTKVYRAYKEADSQTRRAVLAEREANFYAKHDKHEQQHRGTQSQSNRRQAPTQSINRVAGDRAAGRDVDNVVGQLAYEAREHETVQRAVLLPELAEIKYAVDARRLLAQLSHSHGLQPWKYDVTKGKDGGDRIQCGTRNLNVTDFMTKEMNLPWAVAEQLLRDCYAAQRCNLVEHTRRKPRCELWEQYQLEGKPVQALKRKAEWDLQRSWEKERLTNIKDVFLAKRRRIQGDRSTSAANRKAATSVARMQRVQAEQALRESIKIERAELRASQRKPYAELYRDWLAEKAGAGNESALAELRRMRRERSKPRSDLEAQISVPAAVPEHDRAAIHCSRDLSYHVHRNGDVTYRRDGRDVLRDAGRTVQMLQQDAQTIETGLRLAMAKFGAKLTLSGSKEFQERTARIAAETGLRVDFGDPRLNQILQDRRAELEAETVREAEVRKLALLRFGDSLFGLPPTRTDHKVPAERAAQAWYGWIEAPEGDRDMLSKLGVELGEFNGAGKFPARVDARAMQELQAFSDLYGLQLIQFDDGLLSPKSQRLVVPLRQVPPATLDGYCAYLRYMVSNQLGRSWAGSELAEAKHELRQRELVLHSLRGRPTSPARGNLEPES